jgi:hypothetical protein
VHSGSSCPDPFSLLMALTTHLCQERESYSSQYAAWAHIGERPQSIMLASGKTTPHREAAVKGAKDAAPATGRMVPSC